MSNFFTKIRSLPGRHRTNVFALLVNQLEKLSNTQELRTILSPAITEIKTLFHNHIQDFNYLQVMLGRVLKSNPNLPSTVQNYLSEVMATLSTPEFLRFFIKEDNTISNDDLHCRIQRQFESQIAVSLLLTPSENMLASVRKVSQALIALLESPEADKRLTWFLIELGPDKNCKDNPLLPLAFGHFDHVPTKQEVIEVLKSSADLHTVMLIQFMFIRDAYEFYPCTSLSMEVKGDLAKYLMLHANNGLESSDQRRFFFDYNTQAPHLYTDRGRAEFNYEILSKRLSTTLLPVDREKFPEVKTAWYPDCICQRPDKNSPYVRSLVESDLPYVAGPSGMTSLLSCAMTYLGQLNNQEQTYYILAIVAFISGGGLHSIHEVLTVPAVRLGLLPGYKVKGPLIGNFETFFSMFNGDPVFLQCMDNAWHKTMQWMNDNFLDMTDRPAAAFVAI